MATTGIDPGPEFFYIVTLGDDGRTILAKEAVKVADVASYVMTLRATYPRLTVACEWPRARGMRTANDEFELCYHIGAVGAAVGQSWRLLPRHDIKMHLCGKSAAKDGDVIAALTGLLGPKGTKRAPGPTYGMAGDLWQALAVAVTAAENPKTKYEVCFHHTSAGGPAPR